MPYESTNEPRLKVSKEMKQFTALALIVIIPMLLMAYQWSMANHYPWGNHDAGFHYARALADKSLYYQYFNSPIEYYQHYPPMTSFVLASLMRFNPIMMPDYINYDLAVFAIIFGVIWAAYWFYRDINFIILLLLSPLFLVFSSTVARLILLILVFWLLNVKNKYELFACALLIGLTHSTALYLLGGLFGLIFLRNLLAKKNVVIQYDWLQLAIVTILLIGGALLGKDNVLYLPLLIGLVGWQLIQPTMRDLLFLSTITFYFYDTTAVIFVIPCLALGLARAFEEYKAPAWFKKLVFTLVLIAFAWDLMVLYYQFSHTTIQQMSEIVRNRLLKA